MQVLATDLPGVLIVEPKVFLDARGFFLETFQRDRYRDAGIGLVGEFVQDNCSRSVKNTLRGLHFQEPDPQGKLVWAVEGEIFDVAVDIRRGSPTFGRWAGAELSAENHRQLWVPPGFAHGFCVTSASATVEYKCTAPYVHQADRGILWSDPQIGIRWPVESPILSDKDARLPLLSATPVLPSYRG